MQTSGEGHVSQKAAGVCERQRGAPSSAHHYARLLPVGTLLCNGPRLYRIIIFAALDLIIST